MPGQPNLPSQAPAHLPTAPLTQEGPQAQAQQLLNQLQQLVQLQMLAAQQNRPPQWKTIIVATWPVCVCLFLLLLLLAILAHKYIALSFAHFFSLLPKKDIVCLVLSGKVRSHTHTTSFLSNTKQSPIRIEAKLKWGEAKAVDTVTDAVAMPTGSAGQKFLW